MHALEHAVLLSGGGQIDFGHLPSAITGRGRRPAASTETLLPLGRRRGPSNASYLLRALADSEGKRAVTAESLGIPRKSLWEKLRQYGLSEMDSTESRPDELPT